jgi:hypothetical protein
MKAMRATIVAAIVGGLGCTAGPIDIGALSPTSLAAGLVGHWTFDDTAGTQARDSSGNGRHGAIFGAGWSWAEGRFAGGLHLAGSDQVSVGGGFGFPDPTANYSVSAWLRVTPLDYQVPVAAMLSTEIPWGAGPPGGWSLNLDLPMPGSGDPANYHFTYWFDRTGPTDSVTAGCDCFVMDAWTHLAAVVNAETDTLTFYVDGVARQQVGTTGNILPGEGSLYMGRWPSPQPRPLSGTLDDVAIYSRALVPEEVAQLSRAPAPDPF